MFEEEIHRHEDGEIIDERIVSGPKDKFIKMKIKERIAKRRTRKRLPLRYKITVVILAMILGFVIGAKIIQRYITFWKKQRIEYPSEPATTEAPQIKPGEIYSGNQ